jgi:hypothetical protein
MSVSEATKVRVSYDLVESQTTKKELHGSKDITWVNVNFKAGDNEILSKCWGNVSC